MENDQVLYATEKRKAVSRTEHLAYENRLVNQQEAELEKKRMSVKEKSIKKRQV